MSFTVRGSHGLIARALALIPMLGLGACSETTGPNPLPADALIGIWEYEVPGVTEVTIEIEDGGTWSSIEADLVNRVCDTAAGVWSATDGVLTTQTTERYGGPVSEPAEQTPYTRSGSTLTLTPPGEASNTYALGGSFPVCSDYGWAKIVLFAELDGVMTEFSDPYDAQINLETSTADGTVSVAGLLDPEGLGSEQCTACSWLLIDLYHELGVALYPGTYPIEQFGPTGLRAEATYWPDFQSADPTYGSNDSDPSLQPWTGQVVVSTLSPLVAEGSFEFTVFDSGSGTGPPYPSVVLTNGYFRISYN
ncbi:MAG: hypothetical protein P8L45_10700 [Longimicrobiales bacterium]|nr:hypothetical protein [Longimicrobiales bacterium]